MSTPVAPAAAETVLRVDPISSPLAGRSRVHSRIAIRSDAQWEVDLDGGPLTLFVQHGRVGVVLDGGEAQLERHDPLFANRTALVLPGCRVVLRPGDRLVVIHGGRFRVDNDDTTLAIASASRLQQTSPAAASGSE